MQTRNGTTYGGKEEAKWEEGRGGGGGWGLEGGEARLQKKGGKIEMKIRKERRHLLESFHFWMSHLCLIDLLFRI